MRSSKQRFTFFHRYGNLFGRIHIFIYFHVIRTWYNWSKICQKVHQMWPFPKTQILVQLEQHQIQIYNFPESELEPEVKYMKNNDNYDDLNLVSIQYRLLAIEKSTLWSKVIKVLHLFQSQWMRNRLPFAVVSSQFTTIVNTSLSLPSTSKSSSLSMSSQWKWGGKQHGGDWRWRGQVSGKGIPLGHRWPSCFLVCLNSAN